MANFGVEVSNLGSLMNLRLILAFASLALAIAACQRAPPDLEDIPEFGPGERLVPRLPNPKLGTEPIVAARAEQMFAALCIRQLPTFSGTEAEAVAHGLAEGREQSTYFHPDDNLSVSTRSGGCSMVFASNSDRHEIERTLISLGVAGSPVVVRLVTTPSGNEYYAARIGPG